MSMSYILLYADEDQCQQGCNYLDHANVIAFTSLDLLKDFISKRNEKSNVFSRIFKIKDSDTDQDEHLSDSESVLESKQDVDSDSDSTATQSEDKESDLETSEIETPTIILAEASPLINNEKDNEEQTESAEIKDSQEANIILEKDAEEMKNNDNGELI